MKSNKYWEAELPPNFKRPSENDRAGLETFIRAKYGSRWGTLLFLCCYPC